MSILAASLAATILSAADPRNMLGNQSQNEGIFVLPAPGPVTVDGQLDDWDTSGRIWSFVDRSIRERYSAQTHAMWDQDYFYVAVKWRDPTPMYSTVDPRFDLGQGWKSDALQLRLQTDRVSHITIWRFAPEDLVCFSLDAQQPDGKKLFGGPARFHVTGKNGTKLREDGLMVAYKAAEDGEGYTQEIRIPWAVMYDQVPGAIGPDTDFRLGLEFLWGDPTGKTWPVHRYADNMQPGHTSREFFWISPKTWGDADLLAAGKIELRQYVSAESLIAGTIPVTLTIPADATRFTVVVENSAGDRVRNLGADLDPADYAVKVDVPAGKRTVQVMWDGLDDHDRLVEPGRFATRGLSHRGLGAEYEMCFYNPGTPAWDTPDTTGAWGADHSAPYRVAPAGELMAISWPGAEGGHAIIAVGPDGRKKWGAKRAAQLLTADADFVYGIVGSHRPPHNQTLMRLNARNGAYSPFQLAGEELPFDLPLRDVLGITEGEVPTVSALLATEQHLLLALDNGTLATLDKATSKLLGTSPAPAIAQLAAAPDGQVYAVSEGNVVAMAAALGPEPTFKAVASPGVGKVGDIGVDALGNILVCDLGPDRQVKAYTPAGELAYTCGAKGGRPRYGKWLPQTMDSMSSVAVDAKGQVWVVESTNTPRRVSVWSPATGELVRDFIGNTGYGGTGAYVHDQDPTLAYVGPIEMKLDKAAGTWTLTQILWLPDHSPEEPATFAVGTRSHALARRFRSRASGEMREYWYQQGQGRHGVSVVYMETPQGWRPVSAVGAVASFASSSNYHGHPTSAPRGEFQGLKQDQGVYWNDHNGDGKLTFAECEVVEDPASVSGGWSGGIDTHTLAFYGDTRNKNGAIYEYRPTKFDDRGAPVYTPAGTRTLLPGDYGQALPVDGEDVVLNLSHRGYAGPTRFVGFSRAADSPGKLLWYYPNPYPGVHGSHRAPMPSPGLLVGPLKMMGMAYVNDHVGTVTALRGNLGQDFIFTTDGLFVGAMFRDGRLPYESLPKTEEQLRGMPMGLFSQGGEPFNGWFGKQDDGVIRTTTGMARQAGMILRLTGLGTIRRFDGPPLQVTKPQLIAAEQANAARAAVAGKPPTATVKRLAKPIQLDGNIRDFRGCDRLDMRRRGMPQSGSVHLAHDGRKLYVGAQVADPTPMINTGVDYQRLFKTGDAFDLQLRTRPTGDHPRGKPIAGDLRIVFSVMDKKPVAVLMQAVDPEAPKNVAITYSSPVGDRRFDRVQILEDVEIKLRKAKASYVLEAAIPLATLGLEPKPGLVTRGDVGFIGSDPDGMINTSRTYWANKHTNLVNDEPLEAWLTPGNWGQLTFE